MRRGSSSSSCHGKSHLALPAARRSRPRGRAQGCAAPSTRVPASGGERSCGRAQTRQGAGSDLESPPGRARACHPRRESLHHARACALMTPAKYGGQQPWNVRDGTARWPGFALALTTLRHGYVTQEKAGLHISPVSETASHAPPRVLFVALRSRGLGADRGSMMFVVASLLATGLPNAPTVAGENKRELINLPDSCSGELAPGVTLRQSIQTSLQASPILGTSCTSVGSLTE